MNSDDIPVQARAEMDRIRSSAMTIEMIRERLSAGVPDSTILIELAGMALPKSTAWRFITQAKETLKAVMPSLKGTAELAYENQQTLMSQLTVPNVNPIIQTADGEPMVNQAFSHAPRGLTQPSKISFGAGIDPASIGFVAHSATGADSEPHQAHQSPERTLTPAQISISSPQPAAALQTQSGGTDQLSATEPPGGPIAAVNRKWAAEQAKRQEEDRLLQLSGSMGQAQVPKIDIQDGQVMLMDGRMCAVQQHHTHPDILVISDFLTPDECAQFKALAEPRLLKSGVVDNRTGGTTDHEARTSHGTYFSKGQDPFITQIETRISELVNWPNDSSEGMQVMRYEQGQEYKAHYDSFDKTQPSYPTLTRSGGNRVGTFLIYLQAPDGGGSTSFPNLGITVQATPGTVLFWNYLPDQPDTRLLHSGDPVTAGTKWIATKWLRKDKY